MKTRRVSPVLLSFALVLALLGRAQASPRTEIKGTAILDHPCGKIAVQHMGLIHAGKMEEATKLGTKEMQDGWKALPAKDRTMMAGMMKDMSESTAQFSAEITASGLLVVEGAGATLTVKKEHKDANGSTSETWTQKYALDNGKCLISR
jgi:hypothetical protein